MRSLLRLSRQRRRLRRARVWQYAGPGTGWVYTCLFCDHFAYIGRDWDRAYDSALRHVRWHGGAA